MASRADKRRRRKGRTAAAGAEAAVARRAGAPVAAQPRGGKRKYERRETGLDYLAKLGQLTPGQVKAGERFGADYRFAIMESGVAMPSSLAALDSVRGGGGAGLPEDYSHALVAARAAVAGAHAALSYHSGMIAAVELICGRGLRPREIAPAERQAAEIVNGLRVALDLLAAHYLAGSRA